MSPHDTEISRRQLVKTAAAATGGLVAYFYVPSFMPSFLTAYAAPPGMPPSPPNAFIRIAPEDTITMVINHLEMGQGVNTAMAQLIAEELECDWTKIKSVSAEVDPVYNSPMGVQMTGGSTSIATTWVQYRTIGANMREMLRQAAAKRWGVKPDSCKAVNGTITHKAKGVLRYGELAEEAGKLPLPTTVALKKR
jgi:isoquinoline 1-oxidoreductase beta subunit